MMRSRLWKRLHQLASADPQMSRGLGLATVLLLAVLVPFVPVVGAQPTSLILPAEAPSPELGPLPVLGAGWESGWESAAGWE